MLIELAMIRESVVRQARENGQRMIQMMSRYASRKAAIPDAAVSHFTAGSDRLGDVSICRARRLKESVSGTWSHIRFRRRSASMCCPPCVSG